MMKCRMILPLVFAVAFFSCSKNAQEVSIRISGLKGPSGVGMIKMLAENQQLSSRVKTSYELVPSPDIMLSRLLSGETDIASMPVNFAAKLYTKGLPYVMAAVTGDGLLYIVSADSSIKTLQDLSGRMIYNSGRASTPEWVFDYILSKNGLKQQVKADFTYNHIELTQMLAAGMTDTALLPEPFVSAAVLKRPELKIVINIQDEWKKLQGTDSSYPITCVIVSTRLIENNPAELKKFLSNYKKSISWVKEYPDAALKLAAERDFGLPPGLDAGLIERLNLKFVNAHEARAEVETYLKVLAAYSADAAGEKLPDGAFYYKD
jgi:NitT/TauT family transport system substrate-binding protein